VRASPELVVFDLAGTTVRDRGEVADSFDRALAEHGVSLAPAALRAVRGASKRRAMFELLPEGPSRDERARLAYVTFHDLLAERYGNDGVEAIDGAAEQFARLRRSGVRVALDTGFDRDITSLLLDALGWDRGVVDAVVCGDDVARGRPAPDLIFGAMERTKVTRVERVANVGDTIRDLQAGAAAGVRWNLGVLTGAHDRATLMGAPHTRLLSSIASLSMLWPDLA
jgi:phosphonatase-like hydrolase